MIRTIKDLLKPEIIDDSIEVLGQSKLTTKGFESKRTQHGQNIVFSDQPDSIGGKAGKDAERCLIDFGGILRLG